MKLATGFVSSGSFERDYGVDHCQMLPMTGPGQSVRSSLNVPSFISPWFEDLLCDLKKYLVLKYPWFFVFLTPGIH